jgi:hypothetical protein
VKWLGFLHFIQPKPFQWELLKLGDFTKQIQAARTGKAFKTKLTLIIVLAILEKRLSGAKNTHKSHKCDPNSTI